MSARRGRITRCLAAVLGAVAMAATVAEAIDVRSWDQVITNVNQRFVVLSAFDDKAVLDKETQLVWLRSPATEERFNDARNLCTQAGLGRRGWRLPSLEELQSLRAPNNLPAGHPFLSIVPGYYWTSTRDSLSGRIWAVPLNMIGDPVRFDPEFVPTPILMTWCVRGGARTSEY